MRYKALSVKQPWASLIASGEKTIETRTWPTSYRGELLICSSAQPRIAGKPAGVAMCLCRLVACRPMTWRDEPAARGPVRRAAEKGDWDVRDELRMKDLPPRTQRSQRNERVKDGVSACSACSVVK